MSALHKGLGVHQWDLQVKDFTDSFVQVRLRGFFKRFLDLAAFSF